PPLGTSSSGDSRIAASCREMKSVYQGSSSSSMHVRRTVPMYYSGIPCKEGARLFTNEHAPVCPRADRQRSHRRRAIAGALECPLGAALEPDETVAAQRRDRQRPPRERIVDLERLAVRRHAHVEPHRVPTGDPDIAAYVGAELGRRLRDDDARRPWRPAEPILLGEGALDLAEQSAGDTVHHDDEAAAAR